MTEMAILEISKAKIFKAILKNIINHQNIYNFCQHTLCVFEKILSIPLISPSPMHNKEEDTALVYSGVTPTPGNILLSCPCFFNGIQESEKLKI